jgi:MoaA/NifB/PqqE/SkfB family radical SAM enzyme
MPFCYAPWANLDISPQGNISPCCKFQTKLYDQQFNLQYDSLNDYLESNFLTDVKHELEQNIWPAGCQRCQIEEQSNILSMRQLNEQQWTSNYTDSWVTASVAFGNTCNLKCISCNPHSSSKWYEEHKQIYNTDIKPVKFYKENFVDALVAAAPGLTHLDIPGGEPFLSGVKEQHQLLAHYVQTGKSKNITLHYTTNTTIYPDNLWWELWKHFKQVEIQLSIDGVGARNEYIRYPSNWSQTLSNIDKFVSNTQDNLKLSVSHTVSAYNIYYLDEFFTWCYSIGLPKPWLGRVHNPKHMRPTVWPDKQFIIDRLSCSQYSDVKNWIELLKAHDDSEHFETFKSKTIEHDNYRRINFSTVFPELKIY